MKSVFSVVSGAVAVLALTVAPVLAQGGDRGGGAHSGGGAGGGGGAAGGGGTAAASGGSAGGVSGGAFSGGGGYSGGGGGSVASAGGVSGSGGGSGSTSGGFSGGGGGRASSGGASPMGGARPMAGARADRPGRSEAGTAMMRADGGVRNALSADPRNASVPGGSRPNYGNPTIGSAVPRGSNNGGSGGGGLPIYPDNGGSWYWGAPYGGGWYGAYYTPWLYSYYLRTGYPYSFFYYPYDPFYLYGYGAFGLGSMYYDPFWFGASPSSGGAASVFYGASPLSGGEMSSGGASVSGWSTGGYSSSSGAANVLKGGLKLKVTPKDAEVYVDGSFMGRVDQYNGAFQRLDLPVGVHRVELRAKGYNNVSFEVKIEPRDIQSYHGTMQPLPPVK